MEAPTVDVLDGGLSTALGELGVDLDHPLWTARAVVAQPETLIEAHASFLRAGAGVVISAAYQASRTGYRSLGLGPDEADAALTATTALAREAVRRTGRPARVAASVGPYGAVLADGSEYTGRYDLDREELVAFHAERLEVLVASGPDLLACETLPGAFEAAALAEALRRVRHVTGRPTPPCWVAFTCPAVDRTANGDPIVDAVRAALTVPGVMAVGVNCTAPEHVSGLLRAAASVTDLPLVAYPNSGQQWDAAAKRWRGEPSAFAGDVEAWIDAGARLVGGCCGVGPAGIAALADRLA